MKLSRSRISKLKCIACGSREKKLAILSAPLKHDMIVGFATACCNCGHIENYVLKNKEETVEDEDFLNVLENRYEVSKIRCGAHNAYCSRRKCKFWKDCHRKKLPPAEDRIPKSVYRPMYEVDKSTPPPAKVNCDNTEPSDKTRPFPSPERELYDNEDKIKYDAPVEGNYSKHDAPASKKNRFI